MTLYSSAGEALLLAFNDSLHSQYTPVWWADKIKEGDWQDKVIKSKSFNLMNRTMWIAQAGQVRGYLRHHMTPADYAWLRVTHTHDENEVGVMYQWLPLGIGLVADSDKVRASIKKHHKIFLSMIKKAIKPHLVPRLPVPPRSIRYRTLENWQCEVGRACLAETQRVRHTALQLIDQHPEWTTDSDELAGSVIQ